MNIKAACVAFLRVLRARRWIVAIGSETHFDIYGWGNQGFRKAVADKLNPCGCPHCQPIDTSGLKGKWEPLGSGVVPFRGKP